MTDFIEISKRMRVTNDPNISKSYLEVKTVRGWKKVWWKKVKRVRYNRLKWLDRTGKISLFILLVAMTWALLVKINHY